MKTAIIYATKHGTTASVAAQIKAIMPDSNNVELFNLAEKPRIEFRSFERIIIGTSVYAGSIQPKARKFIEQNMVDLLQKEIGLFVCCMFFEKASEQMEKGFPEVLRNHARSMKHLGGEFRFEEMNAIERFLVKKITGATETTTKIDTKAIELFVSEINKNKEQPCLQES